MLSSKQPLQTRKEKEGKISSKRAYKANGLRRKAVTKATW